MIDKLFTFEDKYGNLFHCKDGKITLQLSSESRIRNIGEIITIKGLTIYKKFEQESGIYRKTNSWSLPKQIFEKIDGIWFYTDKHNYKVLTKDIKNNIHYLNFCNSGYESKIYIPLKLWQKKRI